MASIASQIAAGLLKGVAGKIGALIFNAIFPPGEPSYFGQVYEEITKIIHQEVTQNEIDTVDGKINGLKNWVINTYTPRKEDKSVTKQELYDLLYPQEADLTVNAIGVLQQPNFAKPSLSVFMVAAGMHLAILQELAYVDPYASNPSNSSYAKSIEQYAKSYSKYAASMYNAIEGKRVAYIWLNLHYKPSGPGGEGVLTCQWVDDYTGQQGYTYTTYCEGDSCTPLTEEELKQEAEQSMQEHISEVKAALNTQLPYSTISDWSKLTTQPLPN